MCDPGQSIQPIQRPHHLKFQPIIFFTAKYFLEDSSPAYQGIPDAINTIGMEVDEILRGINIDYFMYLATWDHRP